MPQRDGDIGSVRLTLDNNGTAFSGATYDPWGSPERGSVGTFGFTGELQQGDNVYLRARWYNATNGTFTSKDRWSGIPQHPQTLHAYGYVGNNPINLADPSGNCYEPIAFLRSIEPLNCSNLDKAIYIANHPNASLTQQLGANTYISAWTVSHAALLVGGGIFAWEAASWAAIAGQSYLIAHPTAATVTTVAGGVAGFSDDLLMAGAALTGDADAAGQIMTAQQLGAADGNLPFGDLVATAGLLKWHGARLAKGGLPSALADCLTYNPYLETQGITVYRGEDAERLLRNQNAGALYWALSGGPGVLVLPENPTRLQVIEELIHLGQHRRAGWVSVEIDPLERARREIEAQHMLLEIAARDGWTPEEIDRIKRNLGT